MPPLARCLCSYLELSPVVPISKFVYHQILNFQLGETKGEKSALWKSNAEHQDILSPKKEVFYHTNVIENLFGVFRETVKTPSNVNRKLKQSKKKPPQKYHKHVKIRSR